MAFVRIRREGPVAVLVLDRPEKLNALSTALERDLALALEAEEVRAARAVVLAGAGRAFSAGADVHELRDQTPEAIWSYYLESGAVYERVAALPQPTVAAIHGYCLGGGLELALACDLRVADETAVFGFPEVGLGILPSSGGTVRLVAAVGPARAKELLLLRDRFDAREAERIGLVTAVVRAGEVESRAVEMARRLAELPPLAVRVTKAAVDAVPTASREAGLLVERLAYGMLAQTEAHERATAAFDERSGQSRGGG
ncbi:MAG: enoyl-CoA hydratase [Actinomycetota bacterium]|nr:MAG: enoyl-CoA hydratase [Actinomycetota bacterium]